MWQDIQTREGRMRRAKSDPSIWEDVVATGLMVVTVAIVAIIADLLTY